MKDFPTLPSYKFSWRSIFVEPTQFSEERICVGVVLKGEDQTLMTLKLIPNTKLKSFYGTRFSARLIDAIKYSIVDSESYYQSNQLSKEWIPSYDGFFLGKERSSLAENIADAAIKAAITSSSYALAFEMEKNSIDSSHSKSAPETWRKNIYNAVVDKRSDLAQMFEKQILLKSNSLNGISLKFGFLSPIYAAHFDALSTNNLQSCLMRAQSKLWQLDLLRDHTELFTPDLCELIVQIPEGKSKVDEVTISEFVDELSYEAARKEIHLFTTTSFVEAANRVIKQAA